MLRTTLIQRRRKLIAFGWYGGKYSHLNWLLPLLPESKHFCEPFGGSAAVLLNRDPSPVETYNDADGDLVNFFRVLRDRRDELIEAISLTPFSREELAHACGKTDDLDPIERARRFYVRARQTRTGLAQTASVGRWATCKGTSRGGMSGAVRRWLGGIDKLDVIAERLLRVQIENRPATEVVSFYDSPDTLFYCDPPYVHITRGDRNAYGYEMTDQDYEALARVLNGAEGKVALSNYDCDLMNDLFPPSRWRKVVAREKTIHSTKDRRREVLWVNYELPKDTVAPLI
jgi:DNA adenine methylase